MSLQLIPRIIISQVVIISDIEMIYFEFLAAKKT